MLASWIYDPATDRTARVIRLANGQFIAQCSGIERRSRDMLEAVARAEQMAAVPAKAKRRKRNGNRVSGG